MFQHIALLIFIVACRIFFSCGTWNLVPRPGMEAWSITRALEAWSVTHWATREPLPSLILIFVKPCLHILLLSPLCQTISLISTSVTKDQLLKKEKIKEMPKTVLQN